MRIGKRVGYCWWVFLEFKPEDLWVGAFWSRRAASGYYLCGVGRISLELHVWVCVLPMVPVHVIIPLRS